MKQLYLIIIAATFLSIAGSAQQKWHYAGSIAQGLAVGSSTAGAIFQTVHGLQHDSWFGGFGVGYDTYGIQGIPLVAHAEKSFLTSRRKPFVYGQAGIHFSIKTGDWKAKDFLGKDQYDLKNGFIGEIGAGYEFSLGQRRKTALFTSVGYSYKYIPVTYNRYVYPPWISFIPADGIVSTPEEQQYYYRRILFKFGFKF